MKVITAVCAAVVTPAAAGGVSSGVTPVQKVIELLSGMLTKAKSAKQEEVVQWTHFKQFCSDSELDKQNRVKAMDLEIEELQAAVQKHDADVERLEQELAAHETEVTNFKASIDNATSERDVQHQDYALLHVDYTESVHAITDAIKVLKEQVHKTPQSASLLEKVKTMQGVPPAARKKLEVFLAQDPEQADAAFVSPPSAYGYETQSGGIITLLEELLTKFKDELLDLEKDEMNNRHAYDLLVHDFKASIAAAENEISKKAGAKAESKQKSADASAQLTEVSAMRTSDMSYLEDLKTTCNLKMTDFQTRQTMRDDEVKAIEQAIEILSGTVASAAEKHSLHALQQHATQTAHATRAPALIQKSRRAADPSQVQATEYLKLSSAKIGSHVLAALAMRVQDQPFDKVKTLIQELIARLQQEATEEADHKAWCDTELGTNLQTRTGKSTEVETLHNTIDQLTNEVAQLKANIATLSEAVAVLTAEMAKATEIRQNEKDENEATIADAVGAQMAVAEATKILKDFYDTAATSTVFAQQKSQSVAPPIFDAPFKGQQKEHANVLAFLEVIQSDFARLETETSSAEQAAVTQYDTYMTDAGNTKATTEQDISDKKTALDGAEQDLATAQNDLTLAQQQLNAALAYYDTLKPSCLGTAQTQAQKYDERVLRRQEEMQSLKECLAILNGETMVGAMGNANGLYSSVDGGNLAVGATGGR